MPKFLDARSKKRRRQRRKQENELRFNCLDSKQENRTKTCNAQPKVEVNSQSEYDIPITHVNSMDVCSPKNSSTIETSNFQSTAVVKNEPLEYNDDICLTQLNSKDVCTSLYIKSEEIAEDNKDSKDVCTSLYIKSEEIAEDNKDTEVTDNFMLYELNARNPVVLNANQLNTEPDRHTKSHASEIAITQHLQHPHSENSKIRIKNTTISKIATSNCTTTYRLIPKTPYFVEIPGKSSLLQKASSGRKAASLKINKTAHTKMLANFSEGTSKCACHLNPMKNVDVHSNLELKDFFERMFEETRKLKLEDRQTIKTELLKVVSQAQEDVEAGKFCERCYTMLAQPKKRC